MRNRLVEHLNHICYSFHLIEQANRSEAITSATVTCLDVVEDFGSVVVVSVGEVVVVSAGNKVVVSVAKVVVVS